MPMSKVMIDKAVRAIARHKISIKLEDEEITFQLDRKERRQLVLKIARAINSEIDALVNDARYAKRRADEIRANPKQALNIDIQPDDYRDPRHPGEPVEEPAGKSNIVL